MDTPMPGFSTLFLPNTNPAQYTTNNNVSQDASKLVYPILFQEAVVFSSNENENHQKQKLLWHLPVQTDMLSQ